MSRPPRSLPPVPDFSPEQKHAIDIERHGEDACVVAGPGSGKTTVLVERYRQLVQVRGIPVHRILAITFTEKAANNMKTRLSEDPALRDRMESAWVSTVHGFCLRLIRENAIAAGVDPGASILDEGQGVLLQSKCLTEALDLTLAEQPERMTDLIRSLASPEAGLLGVYDAIRSAGVAITDLRAYAAPVREISIEEMCAAIAEIARIPVTPKQRLKVEQLQSWYSRLAACRETEELLFSLGEYDFPRLGAKQDLKDALDKLEEQIENFQALTVTAVHAEDRETLIEVIERFDHIYASRKRERGVLDFADLESYAVRLLSEHPGVRARMREHFEQILMDEFQDTNGQQARLLELLRAPDRFYAVGDLNQSIFGFRHASPKVFRTYRDHVQSRGKHHAELEENWRSRPEILYAAETLLHAREGIEPRRLRAARKWPVKKQPCVEVIAVEPVHGVDPVTLEAQWVARRMIELRGKLRLARKEGERPAQFRDMAVLVRNSAVLGNFAAVFDATGIPYDQSRRKGFLETREALDLTHLLRTIANPRDEVSLAAVLRSPLVAVSDEALLRLKMIDENLGAALDKDLTALDETDRARLEEFRARLKRWRADQPYLKLDRLILRALDESGYPWEPDKVGGANIEQYLELARAADSSLADFLDEVDLLRTAATRDAEVPFDSERDAVRMMTAHSAKGLEFPIVFVAALQKGTERRTPEFTFTPEFGLGTSWVNPAGGEPLMDAYHLENSRLVKQKEDEEENRLLYVAVTRAEEHLVLSYSRGRRSSQSWAALVEEVFAKPQGAAHEAAMTSPFGDTFRARVMSAPGPPPAGQMDLLFEDPFAAQVIERPRVTDQHDNAITVTAAARFADCPRRYYLAHHLGWQGGRQRLADIEEEQDESDDELDASELGQQVHALLAGAAGTDPLAQRLAAVFHRSELGQRAARATHVEREYGFLAEVAGVILRGQIDLWFEESGELVLVDYKTDEVAASDARARAESYALQIHLYAMVLQRLTGRLPDRAYLHFLRPDAIVPIAPDPLVAERVIAELTEAQNTGRFPLREGEHCVRCPFYQKMCPAGRQ